MKKKKDTMGVEGHQLEVHQQKQFLMNNQKGTQQQISFEDFLQVYGSSGEDPESIEKDFQEYLKF
jgi:hypothetical protein